uniref:Uncharacterized protein n=1 Tax=Anguilla anguilla TaxID=7936 RepID=A0A0E9PLF0_ANGAN
MCPNVSPCVSNQQSVGSLQPL